MTYLKADKNELERWVKAVFRYADPGSFAALRGFDQVTKGGPARLVEGVKINGDLGSLVDRAAQAAERCANSATPIVFAPPICTFSNGERARGADLANGLVLSVELDEGDTMAARRRLEGLLGVPTAVIASGGEWIHPDTGEIHAKLHLHWRLSEPTRDEEDHAKLRQARDLACQLAGGDPTGKPVVHPLRWPGSWNLKAKPVLARIVACNDTAEIHLQDAVDALSDAAESAGMAHADMPRSGTPQAPLELVRSAMMAIPNQEKAIHYDQWIRLGYACYRATAGSGEGRDVWDDWSKKSEKFNAGEQDAAWKRISKAIEGSTAPRTIGAGTIFFHAKQEGWERPRASEPPPNDDDRATTTAEQPQPTKKNEKPIDERRLPLVYFEDIHPNIDAADFVEGILVEGSMAVVYGESNCGKTFFMTDLGLHIALGRMWRRRAIELSGVIYCALEGAHGISNRVAAFRAHHGLGEEDVPFAIIPYTVNMLDPEGDTQPLINTIKDAAERMRVPVRLVVIDTLSRALAGGNENAPDDMGALVTNTDKVRQATAAAVCYIHHSGKDTARGARGHSLLRAATDTEIEVSREDKDAPSRAVVTKQREMEIEGEFVFKLQVVELGTNKRGKAVTSCVVVESEAPERPRDTGTKTGKLPPNAALGMRALTAAMSRSAAKLPPLPEYPANTSAVAAGTWRDEFYQLKSGTTDTKKHAFSTAETVLLARNIITERNGLVWFARSRDDVEEAG